MLINKKELLDLIDKYVIWSLQIRDLGKIFDYEYIYECNFVDYPAQIFQSYISLLFDEDGVDELYSYILNQIDNNIYSYDKSFDELWKFIKNHCNDNISIK